MTTPPDTDTSSTPAAPTPAVPSQGPPTTPRRGGSFLARLLAALLVVIITTAITLTATAGALLWAGFTPATGAELAAAQARMATLEAGNAALANRAEALATEVADLSRRTSDDREVLGEVRAAVEDMSALRAQIRDQLTSVVSQNATLVADARASRDQVTAFATAEAGRMALLQDLDRRSQRIERFLQRLSDIAGDTALDLGSSRPVATPEPAITVIAAPTATPLPAASPDITATPAVADTATALPAVTATPTARSAITATATPSP